MISEVHMERLAAALLVALTLAPASEAVPTKTWVEGRDYVSLMTLQYTTVPAGKVEVMEVFSYGCPACNSFEPVMSKLRHSLPPNAQVVLLPASFKENEDWPMFQRAYFAAQSLGIAERTHQGIFDAVWKTGELAVIDPATHRLRSPEPSLEDAARCYARLSGVKPQDFIAAANSFAVNTRMRAADEQIFAMQVPGTPCIVVNGRYRVNMDMPRSGDELIDLVRFLVAKETKH
jgi:protein dithiol oxidoreductase (disulfide-forming)